MTRSEAEQAHINNKHAEHGFADDFLECGTERCMLARRKLCIDLEHCPTCGVWMGDRGSWIHAGAEPTETGGRVYAS